jgi:drug/metabolite transporter (DMT)-like permease
MIGLWVWSVIVLLLGAAGTIGTLYEIAFEANFKSIVPTAIGSWIWAPVALRAARRQDLNPRWFWVVAGTLGGPLAMVPIWHHGREWKSTRTQVVGWLIFIAVACWLVGQVTWAFLVEFAKALRTQP